MSPYGSRSPPVARRFHSSERATYRSAPYRTDHRRYRDHFGKCNNCKLPGHFARDCPNVLSDGHEVGGLYLFDSRHGNLEACSTSSTSDVWLWHCRLGHPTDSVMKRHIASECTGKTVCWNCKEPGHTASQCNNDPICYICGKKGHLARDCSGSGSGSGSGFDTRVCKNCYQPGHIAANCTNDEACNNCHQTGHLARDCTDDPVCHVCNIPGHVARQCPKTILASEIAGGHSRAIICRMCDQPGHISRDCVAIVICNNCGGHGHLPYECPTGRMFDRGLRRY